jgi:predicted ATPase
MKIKSLSIKNVFLGWSFDDISFTSNLTLLVGASGVGKTQILNAIEDLRYIADGHFVNGLEWKITFSTVLGKEFTWEGAFSVLEEPEKHKLGWVQHGEMMEMVLSPASMLLERLTQKNVQTPLIERTATNIFFNGMLMPKLASSESMLYVLREEKTIQEVVNDFKKIVFKNPPPYIKTARSVIMTDYTSIFELKKQYKTLEAIKNSGESSLVKLSLCFLLKLNIFNVVKQRFLEIFPQVEDFKVEQKYFGELPFGVHLVLKEKGVIKWIKEELISSGMLRTLTHLADLYLVKDGSVMLIDEFENSLGINCIDVLTEDLIHEGKNLQFIATSHHPYIINNIPYEHWKIVSRSAGKIMIRNAADYHLGRSKQDAFIQLTKILTKQTS